MTNERIEVCHLHQNGFAPKKVFAPQSIQRMGFLWMPSSCSLANALGNRNKPVRVKQMALLQNANLGAENVKHYGLSRG
jgi:hypothetical protein